MRFVMLLKADQNTEAGRRSTCCAATSGWSAEV
jgi:hypothetical protein